MLRVAVAGALGRMGRVACNGLTNSADVIYAGGFARAAVPSERIFDDLEELFRVEKPDVLLDLTVHPASVPISMQAVTHGVRPVIGATGWSAQDREALARLAEERAIGAMIVPNFSIGAILMMKFAEQAAKYFPSVEIVELHHDKKKDAPSGTSMLTAERISSAGGPHSASPLSKCPGRGGMLKSFTGVHVCRSGEQRIGRRSDGLRLVEKR